MSNDVMSKLQSALWIASRSTPADLVKKGLVVAVHNHYMLNGERYSFWLMVLPTPDEKLRSGHDGLAFKGEGKTDQEALDLIRAKFALHTDKLHHAPMCPANHYHGQRAPTYECTCGGSERSKGTCRRNQES